MIVLDNDPKMPKTPLLTALQELEAIKERVKAMEAEAEKLKVLQSEVEKQMSMGESMYFNFG